MTELWRAVVGLEGRYEVSSFGRVRSVERVISRKTKSGSFKPYRVRSCVLKPQRHANYLGVNLHHGVGDSRPHYIHRLVAEAFCGKQPSSEHEVNHLDEDRHNNRADNLEWVTHDQNMAHSRDKITSAVRKACCKG